MNFTPLIIDRLKEFERPYKDFTFCHMMLSTLRQIKKDFTQEDLFNITDEEFYTAMGKAIKLEKEEK